MLNRKNVKKPQLDLISTPTHEKNIEQLKQEVETF